jgi:hypothetical protein
MLQLWRSPAIENMQRVRRFANCRAGMELRGNAAQLSEQKENLKGREPRRLVFIAVVPSAAAPASGTLMVEISVWRSMRARLPSLGRSTPAS